MLSVIIKPFILSTIMLNVVRQSVFHAVSRILSVIMLSVVAPLKLLAREEHSSLFILSVEDE